MPLISHASGMLLLILVVAFTIAQCLYFTTFLIEIYFFSLPVNRVDMEERVELDGRAPPIVLLYPVLRELETTMRTTMLSLSKITYPSSLRRIIAIPNADDHATIDALRRLQLEFSFLEVRPVPPTSDGTWDRVWSAWDANPKAHWWRVGRYAGARDLPPKKTRQLIYAFYTLMSEAPPSDLLINYIDADSCPPPDHFIAAAKGIRNYDVLQAKNVAGNLNASMAASWHAFDHMAWDGDKYAHLSSSGRQPYWVLGKGLFFKAADLLALGGFHPWITIEDPEIGLRFWANGKRLGIIEGSLIEEVPETIREGMRQRRRWVCGFFQTLDRQTLGALKLPFLRRVQAWLIFLPCLSLWVNTVGLPTGIWALWAFLSGARLLPIWLVGLSLANIVMFCASMAILYWKTWRRTKLVLDKTRDRLWYMLRINPISAMLWWLIWIVPLAQGWWMYMNNGGLVWQRTEKIDANHGLVRSHLDDFATLGGGDERERARLAAAQEGTL